MSGSKPEKKQAAALRSPSGRNNRRSRRTAPTVIEMAAIYLGGDRYTGQLLNESRNGLGVLLDDFAEIRKGARVRVAAQRKCCAAVVVRCTEQEDGRFVIGLRT